MHDVERARSKPLRVSARYFTLAPSSHKGNTDIASSRQEVACLGAAMPRFARAWQVAFTG